MNEPIVSIITPTYNHEKYITQCIESVKNQTFSNWEMIIINDGSTDRTASLAEAYSHVDPRIHIINQSNKGIFKLAETYNTGLQQAKGKYIAILEGDDLWVPTKLEEQINLLENDPSLILTWGQAELVNENLSTSYYISPQATPDTLPLFQNSPTGSIIELNLKGAWLPALTIVIRKENLLQIGGFLQTHGMPLVDFPTILSLSLQGKFFFQNKVLGQWRIYATQTTKKYTVEIYQGMNQFIYEHIPKVYPTDLIKQKQIYKHFEQLCLIAYARSGRYKLIRKEFKSARADYLKAISYPIKGKLIWRIRALVGYLVSFLHMDIEWIAHLLGKKTYRS